MVLAGTCYCCHSWWWYLPSVAPVATSPNHKTVNHLHCNKSLPPLVYDDGTIWEGQACMMYNKLHTMQREVCISRPVSLTGYRRRVCLLHPWVDKWARLKTIRCSKPVVGVGSGCSKLCCPLRALWGCLCLVSINWSARPDNYFLWHVKCYCAQFVVRYILKCGL